MRFIKDTLCFLFVAYVIALAFVKAASADTAPINGVQCFSIIQGE